MMLLERAIMGRILLLHREALSKAAEGAKFYKIKP